MTTAKPRPIQELFDGKLSKKKERKEVLDNNLNSCAICNDRMAEEERNNYIEKNENGGNEYFVKGKKEGKWRVINFAGKSSKDSPDHWQLICWNCYQNMEEMKKEGKSDEYKFSRTFNMVEILRMKNVIQKMDKKEKKVYDEAVAGSTIENKELKTFIINCIEDKIGYYKGKKGNIAHPVEPTLEICLNEKSWDNLMSKVINEDLIENMEGIYKLKADLDNLLNKFHSSLNVVEEQDLGDIPRKTMLKKIEEFRDDKFPGHHFYLVQVNEKGERSGLKLVNSPNPKKIDISETMDIEYNIPDKMLWDDE